MSIAPHRAEGLELLRTMLEEQFVVQTNRLTELTVYGRLPGHGGYDPRTLEVHAAAARRAIADTAGALRRMSEGSYGRCVACHCSIPLARLRAVPHARHCSRCRSRHAE